MFIGHFAVALASKKAAPNVSLGTLVLGAQFVDLVWPLFLLFGIEHVRIDPGNTAFTPLDFYDYPVTHSLLGAIGWSLILGAIYYAFRHARRSAFVVGLCVFSHWILDLITHRPDLPLGLGGDSYFGLALWNSVGWTIALETALYIVGVVFYLRTTERKDRVGFIGFWSLIAVLFAIYMGNIFCPPPPSESSIAILGNAAWLFVIWAYWVDRHRVNKTSEATS